MLLNSTTYPTNVDELHSILKTVASWNVCQGGPPIQQSPKMDTTKFRKVVKDQQRFRHADCEMFVQKGVICRKCLGLDKLFVHNIDCQSKKRHSSYNNVIDNCMKLDSKIRKLKSDSLRINTTPESRKKLARLRNLLRSRTLKLARKEQLVLKLEETIRDVSEQNVETITSILKRQKVPDAQVSCFIDIASAIRQLFDKPTHDIS